MGEVYRARDTRLNRTVAIKILSRDLSALPEVKRRFEREAKALSEVSHPHICAVYDVGVEGEVQYLVMEYLEGDTLASQVARGALPLSQTLRIGTQIAEALAAAHRRGIVHQDLKPSNVMLTASGAKLLDFGLARITPGRPTASSTDSLPTQSAPTQDRALVGTVPYMSPEQLEGKETDARTDVFALGAVLYEMATGKRAFNGTSQASLISAILMEDPPPIATCQPLCPRSLDRAVSTCLAKDPEARWQSARDVAHALGSISESVATPAPGPSVRSGRTRGRIAWGALAGATLAAFTLLALLAREKPAPDATFTSSILPPENHLFDFAYGPPALSPDGRRIAFVARPDEGPGGLWVRSFDEASANPISGTEGATAPFWSPDSRSLGFFAERKLKRIDLAGGAVRTLCDAPSGAGGAWNRNGLILFVPDVGGPVHRVASTGGTPSPVTDLDRKVTFGQVRPVFLPDGHRFLYLNLGGGPQDAGVFLGSLDTTERFQVVPSRANVAFAPAAVGSSRGYLLFLKDRTLMAQVFDPARSRLTGEAVPVAEQILFNPVAGVAAFSVSENGVLAYQSSKGGTPSRLVWFDRKGSRLNEVVSGGSFNHPRLSHDGRRVVYALNDAQTMLADIWIRDLTRQASTRLTFGPGVNIQPVWSPDDRTIVFSSNRNGVHEIFRKNASGEGDEELILGGGRSKFAMDYSVATGLIALQSWDTADKPSGLDLQVFSPGDQRATTLLSAPFHELFPQFAPDGRWLAYCSNESGRREVYVRPRVGSGAKQQVSTAGGAFPRWSRNGREIFFIAPEGTLMVVDVAVGSDLQVGLPRPLFRADFKIVDIGYPFDVSADGKRFLVNELVSDERPAPITVVQNWTARLKER
jgi:Tol biopolymer transport system component